MKTYRQSIDIAPPIFTSAVDGDEWLVSGLGRFTPRKEIRCPFNTIPTGPQSRYGHFGEDKNILPLAGFEPLTIKPAA